MGLRRYPAAIKEFYKRNDSSLIGDFDLSDGRSGGEESKRTPSADDIREVIKALPLQQKTPMVLMWQTGMEPDAALALTWGKVNLDGRCTKLSFVGRKKHKRSY